MTNGYNFFFKIGEDVLTFPITPGELKIKVGSKNETITLINEGDINVLKSPSLIEVEFEARFPMRNYPFSREVQGFKTYEDVFKDLKENKKSFRFIVSRTTPNKVRTWDTNLLMALEEYELLENAEEGDDVLINFKLKQFKEYGVKILQTDAGAIKLPTTIRPSDKDTTQSQQYTVVSGDCLWNIAKRFYGSGSKWTIIYDANKNAIEEDAKKHGRSSSSNGHWIYPGLKLTIPGVTTGANGVSGSGGSSGTKNKSDSSSDVPKQPSDYTTHRIIIRSNGIAIAKGSITCNYVLYGKGNQVTLTSNSTERTIYADHGSKVQIYLTKPNNYAKTTQGYKVSVTNNGFKHARNANYRGGTIICSNLSKASGIIIEWG